MGAAELSPDCMIRVLSLMARTYLLCGDDRSAERCAREAEGLTAEHPSEAAEHYVAWAWGAIDAFRGETRTAEKNLKRAYELSALVYHGEYHGEFLLEYGEFLAAAKSEAKAREVLGLAR